MRPSVEPNLVKVGGDGVSTTGVPASIPAVITIDTEDAGVGDLDVEVIGPDSLPRKVDLKNEGKGKFRAAYLPDDTGSYKVIWHYF